MVINDIDALDEQSQMQVINRLFAAYDAYDVEAFLSLYTDDAVWTWIDPGKNIRWLGPEGKLIAKGKEEIRKYFELDRGQLGYTGYILWSEAQGNTVNAIELWHNERGRAIGVPLICKSCYRFRGDKIAEWTWVPSPESTRRLVAGGGLVEKKSP
jgi:ketosteroid isomerase-like protein